jgi:hypothetical protein
VPTRVDVLGGSSSVGKTTAAAAVAERIGATYLPLDPIAQASEDPRVRRFQQDVDALWRLPAASVCDLLIHRLTRFSRSGSRGGARRGVG